MKLNKIYKEILKENLLDEDYPTSFDMEYFKNLPSFNARIKYCQQELSRISSGSSRIAYMVDDEKVLKLAKNQKGIAQNEVEIELGGNGWYSTALAQTIDSHPDALWVEMELARPVKIGDFKKYLKLDIEQISLYLNYYFYYQSNPQMGRKIHYSKPSEFNQEVYDWMWEDEFFQDVFGLIGDYNVPPGDFCRKNSYGIVKRNGEDTMVIIDYGLTSNVYDSYYS